MPLKHAAIPLDISAEELRKVINRTKFKLSLMRMFKQAAKNSGDLEAYRIYRRAERRQRELLNGWLLVVPEVQA